MTKKTTYEKLAYTAPDLEWEKVGEKGKKDIWQATKDGVTVQVEIPYAKHNPFIAVVAMQAQRMIEEKRSGPEEHLDL